jgi:hypothetical protein
VPGVDRASSEVAIGIHAAAVSLLRRARVVSDRSVTSCTCWTLRPPFREVPGTDFHPETGFLSEVSLVLRVVTPCNFVGETCCLLVHGLRVLFLLRLFLS